MENASLHLEMPHAASYFSSATSLQSLQRAKTSSVSSCVPAVNIPSRHLDHTANVEVLIQKHFMQTVISNSCLEAYWGAKFNSVVRRGVCSIAPTAEKYFHLCSFARFISLLKPGGEQKASLRSRKAA